MVVNANIGIYLFQCSIYNKGYLGKRGQLLHKKVNDIGHRNLINLGGKINDFQALQHHASVVHTMDFNQMYNVSIVII